MLLDILVLDFLSSLYIKCIIYIYFLPNIFIMHQNSEALCENLLGNKLDFDCDTPKSSTGVNFITIYK